MEGGAALADRAAGLPSPSVPPIFVPCPQLCKVLNATLITCPSPGALHNASAPVAFFINGRVYTDEMPYEALPGPEETLRGGRFHLDYLPDPQFSTARRERWIRHHPGEPLTLVIHVSTSSSPQPHFCPSPAPPLPTPVSAEGAGQPGAQEP